MKLIHTADLRLNAAGHVLLPPEKEKRRARELTECLENMIAYAEKEEADAILILGALFDTGRGFPHEKAAVFRLMEEHQELLFFLLPESAAAYESFAAASELPSNLKLFDANWTQYGIGNVTVSGAVMTEENRDALYENAVFEEDRVNIVLLTEADGKGGSLVEPFRLRRRNIDYLAYGPSLSYHMESLDERGIICASGSPEGLDFAEEGPHGFVLLSIDPEKKQLSSHFVPFEKRRLYNVFVPLGGLKDTEAILEAAGKELDRMQVPETALVMLTLSGSMDIEAEKENKKIIEALSPYCFHLEIEDKVRFTYDPARYEKDVSLKGEFVRRVTADDTLSEEERIRILRMGLQAIQRGEVTA